MLGLRPVLVQVVLLVQVEPVPSPVSVKSIPEESLEILLKLAGELVRVMLEVEIVLQVIPLTDSISVYLGLLLAVLKLEVPTPEMLLATPYQYLLLIDNPEAVQMVELAAAVVVQS